MRTIVALVVLGGLGLGVLAAGPDGDAPEPAVVEDARPAAVGALFVGSASPAPNSATASPDAPLVLTLAQPIRGDRFPQDALTVYGRWSGVVQGTAVVADGGATLRFEPDRPFHHGEWVTATLRKGVEAANGEATPGFSWSFWIRPDAGSLDLVDLGSSSLLEGAEDHVQPYGGYAGDFNGDGYPDLAVPNEVTADVRVLLNDTRGGYSEFAVIDIPDGNWPSPNEGADFNRDGIVDIVVGNGGNDLVSVFLGDGAGGFRLDANVVSGENVRGVCIMDLDLNGWPDVAAVNMSEGADRATRGNVAILLNDGTGRLVRTATVTSPGQAEKTCAVGDANQDGIQDLFVGAFRSDEVLLFLGDGEGGLSLETRVQAGGNPWMIAAGDLNGDGFVDVVSSNREKNNVGVLLGDGRGGLAEPVLYEVGELPLAVDVGDLDGDGDLDVVTSDYTGGTFTIYENAGDGTLVRPRTLPASSAGSCAILHDRDRDGDVDVTGVDEVDDKIFLFENPGRP